MPVKTEKLATSVYRIADLEAKVFSPRGASPNEHFNDLDGASMSGGIVYFKDAELPFTLWYDEILFCHAVEESFEIVVGEARHELGPGDTIWLPSGTSLIYRSKGIATVFFAVTPAGWARTPPQ